MISIDYVQKVIVANMLASIGVCSADLKPLVLHFGCHHPVSFETRFKWVLIVASEKQA